MRAPRAFLSTRGPAGPPGGDLVDITAAPHYAGQTDNYVAINSALAEARARGTGIFIPRGTFVVDTGTAGNDRAIYLTNGDRVHGAGIQSILTRPSTGSDRSLFRDRVTDPVMHDIVLSDFQVDWNAANTSGGPAVISLEPASSLIADGNNIRIERCVFRNAPLASWFVRVYYVKGVTVQDCLFENNGKDNINLGGCSHVHLHGNEIYAVGANGPADGDDNIALYDCEDVVVHGNLCDSSSQDVGRNLWLLGCRRVMVSENLFRGGWRQNIAVWANGDTSNRDTRSIQIVGNVLRDAGFTSAGWGDAIELATFGVDVGFPISDVLIADNDIIDPRRHGINFRLTAASTLVEDVTVARNRQRVDRALSHVDGGRFVNADVGTTGELRRLTLEGNRSRDVEQQAVYLRGANVYDTKLRDERHRDNGTTGTPAVTYHCEDLKGLVMEGCDADDTSGGSRISYGAEFKNLNTGFPVRIAGCDFRDTNTGDVLVTGAFPAAGTLYYDLFNFGAAALP